MLLVAFSFLLLIFLFVFNPSVWLICVSVCSSLGLYCMGLSVLPGLECFLSHVRELFSYYLFKYFLRPFLSLFSFWDHYNANGGTFNIVPHVPYTVLISFHSSFFILFRSTEFHQSVFQLTYSFFCLIYSAIDSL